MKNIYQSRYNPNQTLGIHPEMIRLQIMAKLVNRLKLKKAAVLDIGCYDGTFLSLITNNGLDLHGLDGSGYALDICQKRGIKVKEFFINDHDPLPYPDRSFDLVVAGEIIEHIYDTDYFLQEIHRLLKPGGHLVLSTPNIASLGRRLMLLMGLSPILESSPNRSDSSGHIRYFTRDTLTRLLIFNCFKITAFSSDLINFSSKGRHRSRFLARLFPGLGQSLICLCQKA